MGSNARRAAVYLVKYQYSPLFCAFAASVLEHFCLQVSVQLALRKGADSGAACLEVKLFDRCKQYYYKWEGERSKSLVLISPGSIEMPTA